MSKNVENRRQPRAARTVYGILLAVFFALLAAVTAGTVYGLLKKTAAGRGGTAGGEAGAGQPDAGGTEGMFSGIGTIRISTAGDDPASLIISVVFPYDRNDRPFAEELASKIGDFKAVTAGYLASFTADALRETSAGGAIKRELLARYNALLRLGQIRELYLTDFIWL